MGQLKEEERYIIVKFREDRYGISQFGLPWYEIMQEGGRTFVHSLIECHVFVQMCLKNK